MNYNYVLQRTAQVPHLIRCWLPSRELKLLLSLVVLSIAPIGAQVFTAMVAGYVTDAKGAPVEEAAATLVNIATRQIRETVTDANGHYAFLQLMPGNYDLTIKGDGLNPFEVHAVVLSSNQSAEYSPKLKILDTTQKTAVTAGEVAYETLTAKRSTTLSAEEIRELPTNLRNPLLLAHATAGVTAITTGATPSNSADQYSGRFGLNGGRQNGSAILVDGIAMNSLGNVRTGATANTDVSLSRAFNIFERLRLQLRAEAYNLTSSPQYGRANTTLGSSGYGTVTSTIGNPRNLQLGMRLDF